MNSVSIVNRALKYYLQDESLRKFYGGYRDFTSDTEKYFLGIGEIAGDGFDFNVRTLYEEFLDSVAITERMTKYSGTMGDQETNSLMAGHLNEILGVNWFSDSNIINCDGGQNALSLALRTCIAPIGTPEESRQYLLLPTPCYPYFPTISSTYIGMVAFLAYSPDELIDGLRKNINERIGGVLVNIPHNPLGYVLEERHVESINDLARANNCAVIVDLVYHQTPLDPLCIKLLGKLDPDRTIFLDSFSKKYGLPGLRIGFVASANPETAVAIRSIKAGESISASLVKMMFAGYLLRRYPEVPQRIAETIKNRFRAFLNGLGNLSAYGITMMPPEILTKQNAFYLSLFMEKFLEATGLSIFDFIRIANEKFDLILTPDVRMYPPDKFPGPPLKYTAHGPVLEENQRLVFTPDYNTEKRPFIRLSFGAESRIKEAADKFLQAVKAMYQGER